MKKNRSLKNIIFLIATPLTKRDFIRYGIKTYIDNGIECFIYDFTSIYNYNYLSYKNSVDLMLEKTVIISNEINLIKYVSKISKDSIIISHIYPNNKTKNLFDILDGNSLVYGFVFTGLIPFSLQSEPKLRDIIISALKKPKKVLLAIKNLALYKSIKQMYNPSFIMYAGLKVKDYYRFKPTTQTKLIKCNSFDYDNYLELEEKNELRIISEEYIIFLDEYVPYHPDNLINNNQPNCNPETYYNYLNNYFNKIEKELNTSIIIAAHPRSEYKKIGNKFDGRKIIINKTNNLVKYSKFVIAHSSTAISYAALYGKYINTIYSNDYSKGFNKVISLISTELKINPIEISKFYKSNINTEIKDLLFSFSTKNHDEYVLNYIRENETPKIKTANIFINHLQNNEIK